MTISSNGTLITAVNNRPSVKSPPKADSHGSPKNTALNRAEMLADRADAQIELYKKDGGGNISQIEALINEARTLTGTRVNERITNAVQKLELIKLEEKIKVGISELKEARKGCKKPDADKLKESGISALEDSKKSLLKILDGRANPPIKKTALFLYLEVLSKQDYNEEESQKEAERISSDWKSKSAHGRSFSIIIVLDGHERELTGIGNIDNKDIKISEQFEIIKIKKLLNEASIKDGLNKIAEADNKLKEAKDLAAKMVLGNYSRTIKKEAVILYSSALFRLGDKALEEGLKLSQQWIKGGLNGAKRADGSSSKKIDSDGSYAVTLEDPDISAIMELTSMSDQINSDHSEKPVLDILKREEEPFIKKQALYLYCKALYLQGTKESVGKSAQIYSAWDSDKFDGNIEIDGQKYSCVEKIDRSKDSHILGAMAVIQLANLVKNANQNELAQEDSTDANSLDDMYTIAEIKKDILDGDENYEGARSLILKLLTQYHKSYIKKQALASYLDILLRKSTKDSIKEANKIYQAWMDASKNSGKSISLNIGDTTYAGIQKISFDKSDDSYIIAGSIIAKIRDLIEDDKIEEAKHSALEFLSSLESENPYEDYVKTQAIVSYLEALLRKPTKESTQQAEAIISCWEDIHFKGELRIGEKTYHNIPSLKEKEAGALLANLFRQIGIMHITNSDFEESIKFFQKAVKADPADPSSFVYCARSLFLAEGFRSDSQYQAKYEKALELIYAKLPQDIKATIKLQDILDIILNKDKNSEKFKAVASNPKARLLALLVLEYNSKLALSGGNYINAQQYSTKEKNLYYEWMKDNTSITYYYLFKSQLHYDLAEIYRYQNKTAEARNEYETVKKIDGANWWIDRQISILADHTVGFNPTGYSSFGIDHDLLIKSHLLAPELFYKTNESFGSLNIGYLPQFDFSLENPLRNHTFFGNASIFADPDKTKPVNFNFDASTNGKMKIGCDFKQPVIDKLTLGIGGSYSSDGENDKTLQLSIFSRYNFLRSLSLETVYKPSYHIGNMGGQENRFFSHAASADVRFSRKFFNNFTFLAGAGVGFAQEAQMEYGSTEDEYEIPNWNWLLLSKKEGGNISYTKTNKSPNETGDPKFFSRKYYWVKDLKVTSAGIKSLWHVEAVLTSKTRKVDILTYNRQNPDEKITIDIKTIDKVSIIRKEGAPIIYGDGNTIEHDGDLKPTDEEINKINLNNNPLAASETIYEQDYYTRPENNEITVVVYEKGTGKPLYRLRTVHSKTRDGLPETTLYKLDLKGEPEPAVKDPKIRQEGEEMVYKSSHNKIPVFQSHYSERLSAGLQWEQPFGTIGGTLFFEGNQFSGFISKSTKPNDDYYSLGTTLYGHYLLPQKLLNGTLSISPNITLKGNRSLSKGTGNTLDTIDASASIGAEFGF